MKRLTGRLSAVAIATTMALGGTSVYASELETKQNFLPRSIASAKAISAVNLTEAQKAELEALYEQRLESQGMLAQKYQEYGITDMPFEKGGIFFKSGFEKGGADAIEAVPLNTFVVVSAENKEALEIILEERMGEGFEFAELGGNLVHTIALTDEETEAFAGVRAKRVTTAIEPMAEAQLVEKLNALVVEGKQRDAANTFVSSSVFAESRTDRAAEVIESMTEAELEEARAAEYRRIAAYNTELTEEMREDILARRAVIGTTAISENDPTNFRTLSVAARATSPMAFTNAIEAGEAIAFAIRIDSDSEGEIKIFREISEHKAELEASMQQMKAALEEKINNLTDEQREELDALVQQITEINIAILEKEYEFGMIPEEIYTAKMERLQKSDAQIGGMIFNTISIHK